ncbi:protein of unknown function [Denitratisoma oestradiolicum]|uniref:Uncharacterized protein n=1 Tax=Denitratisoma oestradiolicum TaxID=311182 RepID=A0A6S6XWZ1_9PROT|nr:protein of unknown function [Denitratisoma oestradiolicum]
MRPSFMMRETTLRIMKTLAPLRPPPGGSIRLAALNVTGRFVATPNNLRLAPRVAFPWGSPAGKLISHWM